MAVNIHNLIAAVSPEVYSSNKDELKKIVSEGLKKENEERKLQLDSGMKNEDIKFSGSPYLEAAEKAKQKEFEAFDFVKIMYKSPATRFKSLLKSPIEKHTLTYDSFGESLEPIYFWILDTISTLGFGKIDKLVDNFVSSPGSGHFSEMGVKSSRMQEEAMKILGSINQVLKSILNIIYDLREFKIRLQTYNEYESKDPATKRAAGFALKQIWMDSVDAKRGTTSIKGLAQQFDYVTLIDAFMAAENQEMFESLDLNDRVKRILQQRLGEFDRWLKESKTELTKRFEIEKLYLRSQYNTIQLYSRWVKPYLRSAKQLEQNATPDASLVNMFNTTIFELTLLAASSPYDIDSDVAKKDLPIMFKGSNKRKYSPLIIIEYKFTSYPEKFGQNYGFRGKARVSLSGYALNEEEIKVVKEEVEKDNFGDVFKLIAGTTDESLAQITKDINEFIYDKKDEKKKDKSEEKSAETDPFSALFSPGSWFKSSPKKEEDKYAKFMRKEIKKDSDIEKVIRAQAILDARSKCVKLYQIYKKAHKMAAFDVLDDVF